MFSEDTFPYAAKRRISTLVEKLEEITSRDPEQEVQGIALPVIDAVIVEIKGLFPNDPVVAAVDDLISPRSVEYGEPVRAVDALLVVSQLEAALGDPPVALPTMATSPVESIMTMEW